MSLEVIYVVRHGFRSSWSVDHLTGTYTSYLRSPTGLPTDPALTSHGVEQAEELAGHLLRLNPPIDRIYSSPYYRCLQTILPFLSRHNSGQNKGSASDDDVPHSRLSIRVDPGLSEWYGRANFEHPTAASLDDLSALFADLDKNYNSSPAPRRRGESIPQLYERVASCIEAIIAHCDKEGKKSILISTHAAVVIALGRILTAEVPEDASVDDFKAFTCGLSEYRRRGAHRDAYQDGGLALHPLGPRTPKSKDLCQRCSFGLSSHWTCNVNSDCSFLRGGEERGWRFSGDESFIEVGRDGLLPSALESRPHTAAEKGGDNSSSTNIPKL
ncbi:histidine phosphatase superfamily [Xylaria digitata]|nr:histidine phosphatase superfamily [Xylaria digitata]